MRKFGEFILKYRIFLISGIAALSILSILFMPELKMQVDEDTWFTQDDPTLVTWDRYLETFREAEYALVAYDSENPFARSELEYLSHLTKELETVPYVSKVNSLTSVDDIVGTEKGMEIKALIEKFALSEAEIKNIKERIENNPFIKGNLISKDYKTVEIILNLIPGNAKDRETVETIRKIIGPLKIILKRESEESGRVFHLGGMAVTTFDLTRIIEKDMNRLFFLALFLILIILYLIFRNISAVIFPALSVFLALLWTLGLKGMLHSKISPLSISLYVLILIIGIANSVHLISHFRIEVPRFKNRKDALLETYHRAGLPCFFTSFTTAIGFGSLSISPIPAVKNLGIFASFGIMTAFLLAMIIVPLSLLLIKDPYKLREPKTALKVFEWIGNFNLKYSFCIIILSVLVILAMLTGIPKINVEGSMLKYFKEGTPLRKDVEFFSKKLGGVSDIEIILRGNFDSFKNPQTLEKIDRFQKAFKAHPKISAIYSMIDYLKIINRALHEDKPEYFEIPKTREEVAQSLLLYELSGGTQIREYATLNYDTTRISLRARQMAEKEREAIIKEIKELASLMFKEFKVDITGSEEMFRKATRNIVLTQFESLGLTLILIFGLMTLIFGVRGGLASIVPNIFPLAFVFGTMGYVPFPLNIATVITAAITIGLFVDDTIHYFSHFRHEFGATGRKDLAMKEALKRVGGALFYTSLILTFGFLIFLYSDLAIFNDLGILASIAIVTALIGDIFIAPALLSKVRIFKVGDR